MGVGVTTTPELHSQGRVAGRNGAQGRIRTTDTRIFSPLLYQLSYLGPQWPHFKHLAGQIVPVTATHGRRVIKEAH